MFPVQFSPMLLIWTLILLFCGVVIYRKLVFPALYWRRRNIFHVDLYKRFFKIIFSSQSLFDVVVNAYTKYPNVRYYGSYQFFRPSLFVRDLDLIKKITVKDFDYFHDHFNFSTDRIFSQNLLALKGEKWKNMRATLTPAFTSSKMRQMFELMTKTAENLTKYLEKTIKDDSSLELEMKDLYSKYTNDVIASCAFGIECDSVENVDNEFHQMGKLLSNTFGGTRIFRAIFVVLVPTVAKYFKLTGLPATVSEFFQKIVSDTIAHREKEKIIRPDLIHLLMQAKKGQLKADQHNTEDVGFAAVNETETLKSDNKFELTDELITAQALVFFFAGFETSSSLLSFVSYFLAINPEIQQKLQKEIDENLAGIDGKLCYEAILKMKYLDNVITETLRLYPPAIALSRICTKEYSIPAKLPNETDIVIEKGCLVAIPLCAIHMSPEYFPNPTKFDPDRFSEENKTKVVPGSYIPFGIGPRNCIGSRFALLETKALIVSLFSKFTFVPSEKTEIPLTFTKSAILTAKTGIWLKVEKRHL